MFFFDKKVLYIVIAIVAAVSLFGYISNPNELLDLLLCVPGVLIAITIHEFCHGLAAYALGDDTAKKQGRLTLNPLKHLEPVGLLMLLFLKIGWGKPVEVDPRNIKRKVSYRKAEAIIAIAGPVSNFILAFIFTVIYVALYKYCMMDNLTNKAFLTIFSMIQYAVIINLGLGVFNLIPLPPLDGSKVLKAFLPEKANMWFENYEMYFYMAFVVLWIIGVLGSVVDLAEEHLYVWLMQLALLFV